MGRYQYQNKKNLCLLTQFSRRFWAALGEQQALCSLFLPKPVKKLYLLIARWQLRSYCPNICIQCTYLYIGTENTNVTYFICQLFLSVHLLKLESDTDFNFQSRWNFLHDTYHGRKSILKEYHMYFQF